MPNLFKNKPLNIQRQFYTMMSAADNANDVEVTLYGDVVDERPVDWWTGEPIEGDFIVAKEFIEDLDRLNGYKNVTFRINSYGGDSTSGILLHNRIKAMQAHTTAIIDGVAMSAASIIAVACDTVKMNPASLLMIHKNWMFMFGGYNADNLQEPLNMLNGYDNAAAAAYAKKSGKTDKQCLKMMADVTYLTGREAVEQGFADELIEDAEPITLAASADGTSIFCRGREIHLVPGMFAPDNIPTVEPGTPEQGEPVEANTKKPEDTGSKEGGNPMSKDELRAQYPDLVAEIEADATAGQNEAINEAVQAERSRLHGIDEVAGLFPNSLVEDAKYGNPCSAQEMTLRAAQNAVKEGTAFLSAMQADANESNTGNVESANSPEDGEKPAGEMTQEESDKAFAALYKAKEE